MTCIIADETGRVLGVGKGGPIDHVYLEAGQRQTRGSLQSAVRTAVRQARLKAPVRVVVAGLTGLEPDSPESRTAVRIIRSVIPARIVKATWRLRLWVPAGEVRALWLSRARGRWRLVGTMRARRRAREAMDI